MLFHISISRVDERVSDEHEVGLFLFQFFPCVTQEDLFEVVELGIEDLDGEFRPVERIPEWVVGLVTDEYWDATARKSQSIVMSVRMKSVRVDDIYQSCGPPCKVNFAYQPNRQDRAYL